jgi:hypothetical protein
MPTIITSDQVRALWDDPNPAAVIERGEDYTPVTKEDLGALASHIDTDDDGYPLNDQWEVLADQLNSGTPGEPTSSAGHDILQEITDARLRRDAAIERAHAEFTDLIRSAMTTRKGEAPVTAMARAAQMSRERLYQIRDGRR